MFASPSVGLGASAKTVLRTSFFANCTAPVGTGVFTGFLKPGSAFDPCGDQAAIQPNLYDQFAAVYQRYKVDKCTIRMKITGNDGAGAATWVAAAYPAVDSTALATYQAAASQQYAKTVSNGFMVSGGVGLGSTGSTIKFMLTHDAVVGSKSDAYDSGALVTADPTSNQFMVLPFFLQSSSAAAAKWIIEVDIFQTITFSQKKNVIDA